MVPEGRFIIRTLRPLVLARIKRCMSICLPHAALYAIEGCQVVVEIDE